MKNLNIFVVKYKSKSNKKVSYLISLPISRFVNNTIGTFTEFIELLISLVGVIAIAICALRLLFLIGVRIHILH